MPRFSCLVLLGTGVFATSQSFALPHWSQICATLLVKGKSTKYPVSADHAHPRAVQLKDGSFLKLGPSFSNGRVATVSRLLGDNAEPTGLVAKMLRQRRVKYANELHAEFDLYAKHGAEFAGRVIPIRHVLEDAYGNMILIKPEVQGPNLTSQLQQSVLDSRQVDSLHQLLAWVHDFEAKTGLVIDVNPFNLAWIEDPAERQMLGLKEPSYVFYEISAGRSDSGNAIYRQFYKLLAPGEPQAEARPTGGLVH